MAVHGVQHVLYTEYNMCCTRSTTCAVHGVQHMLLLVCVVGRECVNTSHSRSPR